MSEIRCSAPVKAVALQARVIRANGDVEELGTVAYWHRSRWRRFLWRLRTAFRAR